MWQASTLPVRYSADGAINIAQDVNPAPSMNVSSEMASRAAQDWQAVTAASDRQRQMAQDQSNRQQEMAIQMAQMQQRAAARPAPQPGQNGPQDLNGAVSDAMEAGIDKSQWTSEQQSAYANLKAHNAPPQLLGQFADKWSKNATLTTYQQQELALRQQEIQSRDQTKQQTSKAATQAAAAKAMQQNQTQANQQQKASQQYGAQQLKDTDKELNAVTSDPGFAAAQQAVEHPQRNGLLARLTGGGAFQTPTPAQTAADAQYQKAMAARALLEKQAAPSAPVRTASSIPQGQTAAPSQSAPPKNLEEMPQGSMAMGPQGGPQTYYAPGSLADKPTAPSPQNSTPRGAKPKVSAADAHIMAANLAKQGASKDQIISILKQQGFE